MAISNKITLEQPRQIEAAHNLSDRFKRDTVPLRNGFIARTDEAALEGTPTPLGQIMRSGRGWDARLKTYLTIIWGSLAPTYTLALGANAYSTVAGLSSARQARSAIDALVEMNLLTIDEAEHGKPYVLRLLDERATGQLYRTPSKKRSAGRSPGLSGLFIKIPVGFWTNGWVTELSGPALATLLIYEQFTQSQPKHTQHRANFISPQLAAARYDVSNDTRYRGLKDLAALGLVTVERRSVSKPPYKDTVRQFVFTHTKRLDWTPEEAADVSPD